MSSRRMVRPLHVGLVDDRVVPRRLGRLVVAPGERGLNDDSLRHPGRAVRRVLFEVGVRALAEGVAEHGF